MHNKVCSFCTNIIDFHVKITLFLLHEINEFFFFFFKGSSLSVDYRLSIVRRSKKSPLFVIVFFIMELVLKVFKNFVNLHAKFDLAIKLFNFLWYGCHVVSDSGQLFNIFGLRVDFVVYLIKSLNSIISHALGTLSY